MVIEGPQTPFYNLITTDLEAKNNALSGSQLFRRLSIVFKKNASISSQHKVN